MKLLRLERNTKSYFVKYSVKVVPDKSVKSQYF
jgi:hypothetical protein